MPFFTIVCQTKNVKNERYLLFGPNGVLFIIICCSFPTLNGATNERVIWGNFQGFIAHSFQKPLENVRLFP